MNECVDLLFAGAKVASRNNLSASLIVHGMSTGYNLGQMVYYRYLIAEYQMAMNNGYVSGTMDELGQYKRELMKHTVLSVIDVVSLFCIGIAGLKRR